MIGWLLVVIMPLTGYVNGNSIYQIGPFENREACYAAIPTQGDARNSEVPGRWFCVSQAIAGLRPVPKGSADPSHGNDRLGR